MCKIVDWGKYNYQRTKQLQKNRKTAKSLDMKQIRFGLKIGANDLSIKMNRAAKFLQAGHKVKITLFYRGREQAHKEIGFKIAQKVIEDFGDTIVVDQKPQLAGRQLNFVARASGKGQTDDHQFSKPDCRPKQTVTSSANWVCNAKVTRHQFEKTHAQYFGLAD